MPNQREVLFVGAGLSAAFGFATTNQILPIILRRAKSGELFARALETEAASLREEFETLLHGFLPGILSVSLEEPPTVTDILSLLDHLILSDLSAAPEVTADHLARLRSLFELAICELLSLSIDADLERQTLNMRDALSDWVVNNGIAGVPVTIITTNYDFVLEDAICRHLRFRHIPLERSMDYGLTWRSPFTGELQHRPTKPIVKFVRLHGGVNWLRCRMCQFTYINQRGPIFHQSDRAYDDSGNTCHCAARRLQRVIVAPSFVRNVQDSDLHTIWKAALEELRLGSHWRILGYSLPNEDVAIRSIFIRALRGRREAPVVQVYERNADLEERFRLLFGSVCFSAKGVEDFISRLPADPSHANTA
jgi:NAD-dependent SIR2 family protein deacetylase